MTDTEYNAIIGDLGAKIGLEKTLEIVSSAILLNEKSKNKKSPAHAVNSAIFRLKKLEAWPTYSPKAIDWLVQSCVESRHKTVPSQLDLAVATATAKNDSTFTTFFDYKKIDEINIKNALEKFKNTQSKKNLKKLTELKKDWKLDVLNSASNEYKNLGKITKKIGLSLNEFFELAERYAI